MAKFVSQYPKLKVIVSPSTKMFTNTGEVRFRKGVTVQFQNHIFETDDPGLVKNLKAAPQYGKMFRMEGDQVQVQEEDARLKESKKKTKTTDKSLED